MKINWNFLGGGGVQNKKPSMREYGYFLELHSRMFRMNGQYCRILIISPGLIFVQKAFLLGLFSGELIFRGACYWKEFCVSKWVWLVNKNG